MASFYCASSLLLCHLLFKRKFTLSLNRRLISFCHTPDHRLHQDGLFRELTVRRLSHNEDWGFAPVLDPSNLYPPLLSARMCYRSTGLAGRLLPRQLEISFGPELIRVNHGAPGGPIEGLSDMPRPQRVDYHAHDFIGVAVQYGRLPAHLFDGGQIKGVSRHSSIDAVTLYLMHEERCSDILLYFADHEDEILAQWQFWSNRLGLPRLAVAPDGFVSEPQDRLGALLFDRAFPRRRGYGLAQRRPLFSRVREVGRLQTRARVIGHEIMARH